MKHFFAFLILLNLSLPCLAQWQPTNGPATNTASFFDGGKYVFATTSDGLYRSGDFGATWEIVTGVPRHYYYESVTKSPDSSQIVVIAYDGVCQCVCLFRSTDDGETWQKISTPNFAGGIASLHVGDHDYLLASVARYGPTYSVWESRDGGKTWQENPLNALYEQYKRNFQQLEGKIWGNTTHQLFKGNLDGTGWEEVYRVPDSISIYSYFAYNNIILVSASGYEIHRSTNNGLTWHRMPSGGFHNWFQRHNNIIVSSKYFSSGRVTRSDDGGLTWDEQSPDSVRYEGRFLLKWPYLITYQVGEGVVRSKDLGRHFESQHERLGYASHPEQLVSFEDQLYLANTYAYGKGALLQYSQKNGVWNASSQPPYSESTSIFFNGLAEVDGRVFYTDAVRRSIYRSDDKGISWKDCSLYDNQGRRVISANHLFSLNNSLFLFFDQKIDWNYQGLFRTNDYGATWQDLITPQACIGWGVSMAGNVGDVVFAAKSYSSCLYRSEDLGDTWSEVPVPTIPVSTDTGLVYISGMEPTGKRILLTMRRWERQKEDFFHFVSNDLGNTWQPCEMQLLHTRKFSFDTRTSTLEAGAYTLQSFYNDGVLLSSDGGLHWQTFNEGLPSNTVMDLEADQQYLYASVSGHGLWKRPLADLDKAAIPQPSPPPLDISIGPNPCEGTLRILATERTESGRLEWFDTQGRLLLTQPVDFICDQAIIDIPLQDGFYTYRLNTPSGQATGKLIVKR